MYDTALFFNIIFVKKYYYFILWVVYTDMENESMRQILVICHQRKSYLSEFLFIYWNH